jgi:PAS domain S-box-containing protein
VNLVVTAMHDDAGNLSGFLGIAQDITDRKQWEDKLRRLGRAVEQAGDGIAIVDLDGYVQFVNSGWAEMHGSPADELQGKHISVFHTAEQVRTELNPFITSAREKGSQQREIGHSRKDGSIFPAWTSCSIIEDERGKPIGFVHVASDVTNRKRAEEALRRAKEEAEIVNR